MAKVKVHNAFINNEEFDEMVESFRNKVNEDEGLKTAKAWAEKLAERYSEKFNDELADNMAKEIVSEAQDVAEERI